MSRLKRFAHSLVSGYALIAANVIYTLASVPLALHYLSKEQFGLWALVVQVCNFNQLLIDLGMSGAVARVLIDHKDDRSSSKYGRVIQTGFLILLSQGAVMALAGGAISYWLPQWINVPEMFWREFRMLVMWQCGMLALAFALRINAFVLQAHQRFDICNYAQLGGFAVGLLTLWLGFAAQLGLNSLLVSSAASALFSSFVCLVGVWRLRLLPGKGRWGRPDGATFKELFLYGTDLFLMAIGLQLITASQTLVITRTLGLEATAVWSVATKLFTLSQQLVYRILDFSTPAFSEMMVRGERSRLEARFRDVMVLSGSAGVAVGLTMATCNESFLSIWTRGAISWPAVNHFLMAGYLASYALNRCHIGLACLTKQVGLMKYVYFAEGLAFVGIGLLTAPRFGLAGVILTGILTNILLSGRYGFKRSAGYFGIKPAGQAFASWLQAPLKVLGLLLPAAVAVWFGVRSLPAAPKLLVSGILMMGLSALCLWRFGLPSKLRAEVAGRFFGSVARSQDSSAS
jgi:O-antigen/teichoic acid export membrane protein